MAKSLIAGSRANKLVADHVMEGQSGDYSLDDATAWRVLQRLRDAGYFFKLWSRPPQDDEDDKTYRIKAELIGPIVKELPNAVKVAESDWNSSFPLAASSVALRAAGIDWEE